MFLTSDDAAVSKLTCVPQQQQFAQLQEKAHSYSTSFIVKVIAHVAERQLSSSLVHNHLTELFFTHANPQRQLATAENHDAARSFANVASLGGMASAVETSAPQHRGSEVKTRTQKNGWSGTWDATERHRTDR